MSFPSSLDSDAGGSTALITLSGNYHIVMGAKRHAMRGPGVKMVARGHRATDSMRCANRPVLRESLSTVDRRSVDTSRRVDVVGAAIRLNGPLEFTAGAGIVRAKTLNNVVLDERVAGPAVNSQVRVAIGLVSPGILDRARRSARLLAHGENAYRGPPGLQPLPPTQLPALPDHSTLYEPPSPLV